MFRMARLRVLLMTGVAGAAALGRPTPAIAQFPEWSTFPLPYTDARLVPVGLLQIGFLPSYAHYDTRFDSSGVIEPLGKYFSPDPAGANLFPTLTDAENAVRDLTGNSSYRMNLGKVSLPLDADVRRFPFNFAVGITNRLTLSVSLPLVKTRVQGVLKVDSTGANVGWNLATAAAGNSSAAGRIANLLMQLQSAIAALSGDIAQGSFGCPASVQCADAQALLARAQQLLTDLTAMAQPMAGTNAFPPAAPLASSAAGQAIASIVDSVATHLAALGVGTVPDTFPLPTAALDSAGVQTIATYPEFGYEYLPLSTARRIYTLGDMEASLRFGLLRSDHLRAVLRTGVRLPTGKPAFTLQHAFTLGSGDHALALSGGLEVAWDPGGLGLSGTAIYTHQFSVQDSMRWAPAVQPLAPLDYAYVTSRQLGDVFQAAIYPSLTLTEGIRVYGSAYYYHKGPDSYSLPGGQTTVAGTPTADLMAAGSGGHALWLGGGIYYRAVRVQRDSTTTPSLPVEAGMSYQAAFSGSGGLVPKSTMLSLFLRFYATLWGRKP
jgi:hypothetical protein